MTRIPVAHAARALFAALAATGAVGGGVALAHADVESTSPKAGATARTTLAKVSVRFGGPVRSGTIQVSGPGGVVSRGRGGRDPRNISRLLVGLRTPLKAGAYKASWTAVAADGHKQRGSFSFKVRR